jgi:hypothetical protein
MATTRRDRLGVLLGILLAWGLSLAFIWAGSQVAAGLTQTFTPRQAAALALLLAALPLAAGIGWAAALRHLASHIDGSRPLPGSRLDIVLRFVTNTTEQLALFAVACLALAELSPSVAARLLPVMGLWFLIARALFLAGYLLSPLARSVGFAATFHPTLLLLAYALLRALG